jgi:NADH-quinone oxidoreductase subunit N
MLLSAERSLPVPANALPAAAEYLRFLPEIILVIAATLAMVIEPLLKPGKRDGLAGMSLLALLAALAAALYANGDPGTAFSGLLVVDGYGTLFRALVIVVGALTVLSSNSFLDREGANSGEYYALVLFSVMGQCVMVTANDLIMVFIGLEISSISSYVLAGYLRDDPRANEAALKYFLLGSFATAFLLYGIALLYGAAGSTSLSRIRAVISDPNAAPSPMLVGIAAALMLVGFAFKVSAAPFQMWAPDVYQGAPTPVTGFLSAGPKAAAFAAFLRVFMTSFQPAGESWEPIVWVCALLSMTIGNFAALVQSDVKRMLAYSSIAHAGYVLVAITARSEDGVAAAMFYLAAYVLMNIGALAVISHLSGKGEKYLKVDDLAGLGVVQPMTAAALTVFLLSLIGVPLTAGFFGKFYIFKAALESKLVWLAVLGLLNSAVAAYYYLRILVMMYMREPGEAVLEMQPLPVSLQAALLAPVVGVLLLGIFPAALLEFAIRSAKL